MNAESTRELLLAQHERLRELLATCVALARRHRPGDHANNTLEIALDALRKEFGIHNQTETAMIRELMSGPAPWGALLVDRMLEEHVAEHAAFWEALSGNSDDVATRITDLAEELDAHMAAEERTFLAPMTLRDDVIRSRTRHET